MPKEGQTGKVSPAGGLVQSLNSREVCSLPRGGLATGQTECCPPENRLGSSDQKPAVWACRAQWAFCGVLAGCLGICRGCRGLVGTLCQVEGLQTKSRVPEWAAGIWCRQETFRALISMGNGPGEGYYQDKASRSLRDLASWVSGWSTALPAVLTSKLLTFYHPMELHSLYWESLASRSKEVHLFSQRMY